MKVHFFCPRWGSEGIDWNTFCENVKAAGYDGVETPIPFGEVEKKQIKKAIEDNQLLLIGQYYQSFEKEFEALQRSFENHLRNLISLNPVLIDSQTGKDYFTREQNKKLFELAQGLTDETGVVIAHETHRNKALFAAHVSEQLLRENSHVKITADFSHWCNVAESLLEDQASAIDLACSKAIHIHARVGHAEGPQVNDPRAPEWQPALNAHLQWWDAIVALRKTHGAASFSITPEFGPAPYMPQMPYTQEPLANQWDVNIYMMQLLKKRYH